MDYEVAIEMRNICMGDKRELTRGQIAGEVIDFDKLMKGLKPETVEKCRAYFDEMIKNDEKKEKDESFGCRKAVGRTIRPTACSCENGKFCERRAAGKTRRTAVHRAFIQPAGWSRRCGRS